MTDQEPPRSGKRTKTSTPASRQHMNNPQAPSQKQNKLAYTNCAGRPPLLTKVREEFYEHSAAKYLQGYTNTRPAAHPLSSRSGIPEQDGAMVKCSAWTSTPGMRLGTASGNQAVESFTRQVGNAHR